MGVRVVALYTNNNICIPHKQLVMYTVYESQIRSKKHPLCIKISVIVSLFTIAIKRLRLRLFVI